jgi:hypothetical protein
MCKYESETGQLLMAPHRLSQSLRRGRRGRADHASTVILLRASLDLFDLLILGVAAKAPILSALLHVGGVVAGSVVESILVKRVVGRLALLAIKIMMYQISVQLHQKLSD